MIWTLIVKLSPELLCFKTSLFTAKRGADGLRGTQNLTAAAGGRDLAF